MAAGKSASHRFRQRNADQTAEEMIGATFSLGRFTLSDVAQAHALVDELGSMEGENCNVVPNDCGDCIVEFFAHVGENKSRVPPAMLELVAHHLGNHSAMELKSQCFHQTTTPPSCCH